MLQLVAPGTARMVADVVQVLGAALDREGEQQIGGRRTQLAS